MNPSQPARCLFCSFARSSSQNIPRRQFHASLNRVERQRRSAATPQKSEKGGVSVARNAVKNLSQEVIEENYTAKQGEAIRRTQELQYTEKTASTTPKNTPWSIEYFDDFTQIDPIVDKPIKAPWTNTDLNARLKTEDEFTEDLHNFMENLPEDEELAAKAFTDFEKNLRLTVGKEENERNARSAMAPQIPKMEEKKKKEKKPASGDRGDKQANETSPALLRLMQMTGYNQNQLRQIRTRVLVTHGVVNQTRLGKIRRMYFLSIAGNGNGMIGIGEGKSEEAEEAMLQSHYRAIRNMQPIMRYENRTILGEVKGKSGATELELFNRPPGKFIESLKSFTKSMTGFGLRCQAHIWEIAKCAGIHDLAARVTRARNPMNIVKATVQALLSQKDPEDIARARGKKLVDVRKVYYAGNV